MNSTQNFSGLANVYTVGRPTYAREFIDAIYFQYGVSEESVIADIGSGTGKLAKQLLDKGSTVYGVEPNDDMRGVAVKELENYAKFKAVKGTASRTTLSDRSVNFITVAQAFHWFQVAEFKKECKRILQKDGLVFLVWNLRDMSNVVNQESYEIFEKYCPRFKGFSGGIQKDDIRIKEFFDNEYEYVEFENPLFYDKETFIKRSLSGSYSLKQGDENFDEYVKRLNELFDKYEDNGCLEMANHTVVYIGKMRSEN